jgi:hypothetical protein
VLAFVGFGLDPAVAVRVDDEEDEEETVEQPARP